MWMLIIQIAVLLLAFFVPLLTIQKKRKSAYKVNNDTSSAEYAINEHGELERIGSTDNNSRINNQHPQ